MSYSEFVAWCEYRNRQGSLHIGMRIDRAVARAMASYFSAMSKTKRYKVDDFSPFDAQNNRLDMSDPAAVFSALKGMTDGK